MKIPHQQLSPDTLYSLVEEFVTRGGTDYGEHETSLQQKVQQVIGQLAKEDAFIVFDAATETCTILSAAEAQKFEAAATTADNTTDS
ncbi:MAG: YheU family protein [Gammaproteobacteria bacterium]|nr:YheU family protein [Gammaproteobacteria bacterium]